jgi:hypothetical protein
MRPAGWRSCRLRDILEKSTTGPSERAVAVHRQWAAMRHSAVSHRCCRRRRRLEGQVSSSAASGRTSFGVDTPDSDIRSRHAAMWHDAERACGTRDSATAYRTAKQMPYPVTDPGKPVQNSANQRRTVKKPDVAASRIHTENNVGLECDRRFTPHAIRSFGVRNRSIILSGSTR